jgi:hypothetical protein
MNKIILLMMVLLPCTAVAAGNCRVIEYPDHSEAICDGNSGQPPASQPTAQPQTPGQEQNVESAQIDESDQIMDVPAEMIVRNELARLHMDTRLKTRPNQ